MANGADPFGVVRYGETENFTEAQITALFDILPHLTEDDPYLLSRNRDNRTAAGLMIFAAQGKDQEGYRISR